MALRDIPARLKAGFDKLIALIVLIGLAASLSYLGVGVQPPTPSWGGIINTSQSYLTTAPWLVIFPGLAIILTSIGFNLFGEALRDALDVGGRR